MTETIRLSGGIGPDDVWWKGWYADQDSTRLECLICGVFIGKMHRVAERHLNWHASHGEHVPGHEPA